MSDWKTIPGTVNGDEFNSITFNQWLEVVESKTLASGQYDVAMMHIGQVLLHAPKGSNLWIHPAIAKVLNQKGNSDMRKSYKNAIFNSRGAHWVDPEAKPEKALAVKYYQRAEDVENEGYHRLATTLRELADGYEREAERIIKRNNN